MGDQGFKKIYPNKIPFVSCLSIINVPTVILGWGWKAKKVNAHNLRKRKFFSDKMYEFVKWMSTGQNRVSCRDWYTYTMLQNQGVKQVVMTGCPAWYDVERVKDLEYKGLSFFEKENPNMMISDAAFSRNLYYMDVLLQTIRNMFPNANITLLMHRGKTKYNKIFLEKNIRKNMAMR